MRSYYGFGYTWLINSTDGLNWERAKHCKVLEKTFYNADGSKLDAAPLEHSFIYLKDGEPKVLTLAIREKSGHSYSPTMLLSEEK